MNIMNAKHSGILLVEDNRNDEELTCRVLRANQLTDITVARDGAEAVDYLHGRGVFSGRDVMEQPVVVLLDLNLPKLSGLEVLKAIRSDDRTTLLPVVILTSSGEEGDLLGACRGGANSYVVKPVEFDEFSEQIKRLGLYWTLTHESLRQGPE